MAVAFTGLCLGHLWAGQEEAGWMRSVAPVWAPVEIFTESCLQPLAFAIQAAME
jgi:hypothetical protein